MSQAPVRTIVNLADTSLLLPDTTVSARVGWSVDCTEPVRRAVMVQRWTDVVFLHWRYDPAIVQALLPPGLTVDEFDGSAWVGLVPFRMEGLGFPGLAPLPLVGTFPEINVRTYVRRGGRRGVWFFSLDVDRRLPAAVARLAYHLPYFVADATHERLGDVLTTHVERHRPRGRRAGTDLVVQTGAAIAPGDPLDAFLTARWGLFSATRRGGLRYAPIDHAPWPLQQATTQHVDDRLIVAAGLPAPDGPPHVRSARGVDVRVGRPLRLTADATPGQGVGVGRAIRSVPRWAGWSGRNTKRS